MIVRHKKAFLKGIVLLLSFIIMAIIMLMPIFSAKDGSRLTSLEFADSVFNSLSKGSSNFMDDVAAQIKTVTGKNVQLQAHIGDKAIADLALKELQAAGIADASLKDGIITFGGNFENILQAALLDSRQLFHNEGKIVSGRYGGVPPLDVSLAWWRLLQPCVKELQLKGDLAEAKVLDMVIKKAIEPANNFYGISEASVADNMLLMIAMLVFYVLYAIWYGFGIYNIFDGLGLMGSSAK